ncbi:MAG: aminotransferase class III-fold pyridoxal phosphate-dependent enzyme, partial [Actinomycetota bacterium]|nr:aminotransferase class III-fold pyridoxal phosphate-dependent enzyme [Actinomycetota bacterium]
YLHQALAGLDGVGAVRGVGLLMAVELAGKWARPAAARALDAGLIVNPVTESALRLAPSLLISEAELDEGVAVLASVLATPDSPDRTGRAESIR